MFVFLHDAPGAFWSEVERRFPEATVSMDGHQMLRLHARLDADDAWMRARELFEFGIEKGAYDLVVHVASRWDEGALPPNMPPGCLVLAESVGRSLLSRESNERRVERVQHQNWRGWIDLGRGEPVPPPLRRRPDGVERFVGRSPLRPNGSGVLSRHHRIEDTSVDELLASLEVPCVRVLAPARTGKSYVAARLHAWAESRDERNVFFTRLCHGEPSPSWRWSARELDEAIWIVDGVDEAILHGSEGAELLEPLQKLDRSARRRLRLVLFQRDEGDRRAFDEALERVGFRPEDWHLRPVDEIEARRVLSETHPSIALEKVVELATTLKVAKERWLSPPLIRALATTLERSESPRSAEVWRELRNAAIDPVPENVDRARLRTLAERVAVATLLSGSPVDDRMLDRVLEDASELEHRALLRTELFVARADATFAFRERHLEESLAIGRLEKVSARVLQRLLTVEGSVRNEAHGLVEPLREVRPELEPLLDAWRSDEARPLEPGRASEVIRALASKQTRWFGHGGISRLAHPAVDSTLCEVLATDPLPPGYRVVFEVAKCRKAWVRFDAALRDLLGDASRSWELRAEAAYYLFYGDDPPNLTRAELQALQGSVASEPVPDEEHSRTDRANVLALLWLARLQLEPSHWAEVALHAPCPDSGLSDARSRLQAALEETMTVERALWVLDRASSFPKRLREKAAHDVVARGALDDAWLTFVTKERTRNEAVRRALEQRWRDDPKARKFCFEHGLWGLHLDSSDVPWLLEHALSGSEHATRARDTLFGLASSNEEARQAVTEHLDETWTQWREERRREEETWRASLPAFDPAPPRPYLLDELRKRLDSEEPAMKRFHWITFLCFSPVVNRSFRGSFAEADRGLRTSVLRELRALLKQVVPTSIPSGNSYPVRIAEEAAAIVYAVVQSDRLDWLDESTLRRWLPTALFVGHEHLSFAIELCAERHEEATREVVLEQLRRDVRRHEHPAMAAVVPTRWLSEALPSLLQEHEPDGTSEHRARLLDLARTRRAVPAGALREWAVRKAHGAGPLAAACTRWLLSDPTTRSVGLRALEEIPLDANDRLAACLRDFVPTFYANPKQFEDWNERELLALLERLCRAPVAWGDLPGGFVTDEHRLQALRATLIDVGVRRFGDAALDRIPEARREAYRILIDAPTVAVDIDSLLAGPARLSVAEVLQVLNGDTSPRSLDDVFFDVVQELRAIAQDVGEHRYLILGEDNRRDERALQEYLHARLKSGLGKRYLLSREPVEAYGDRPDFVLIAHEAVPQVIPIELKWSYHRACKTALGTQLVRQYLIDQHRTHGLYVVGFVGETPGSKKKTSAQDQIRTLSETLETKRRMLVDQHPELRIEVVVLPIVRD